MTSVLYVVAMAAVVVGVDVLFFRGHVWEQPAANLGIVLVFGAVYFRFLITHRWSCSGLPLPQGSLQNTGADPRVPPEARGRRLSLLVLR